MKEVKIESFDGFHTQMRKYLNDRSWLFRGQNRIEWSLVPKFGRNEYKESDFKSFFESWKRKASELITVSTQDDWDWLAIAQHHGLATNLLDWSYNPLVAAFFAVFPEEDEDCCIYAYNSKKTIATKDKSIYEYKIVGKFKPRGVASRISRQGAIFTYHNPTFSELEKNLKRSEKLERIIIEKKYRRSFIFELDRYGINTMNLFPDLDGLSSYCNWSIHEKNSCFWNVL